MFTAAERKLSDLSLWGRYFITSKQRKLAQVWLKQAAGWLQWKYRLLCRSPIVSSPGVDWKGIAHHWSSVAGYGFHPTDSWEVMNETGSHFSQLPACIFSPILAVLSLSSFLKLLESTTFSICEKYVEGRTRRPFIHFPNEIIEGCLGSVQRMLYPNPATYNKR